MFRRMLAFIKSCWHRDKSAFVYAALMLLACLLVRELFFVTGAGLQSAEEKAVTENVRSEAKVTYGQINIIPGDITDRKGTLLVSSKAASDPGNYRDAEAYTQAIGFSNRMGDYLMAGDADVKAWRYDAANNTDKGCTVQTTLDADLQEYAYSYLKGVCDGQGGGNEGSLVVMDAKTGAVLTWAFYPSFDANRLMEDYEAAMAKAKGETETAGEEGETEAETVETAAETETAAEISDDWRVAARDNFGCTLYPMLSPRMPGSIFKIVTSIGLIETGPSALDTPVYDDTGYLDVDGTELYNVSRVPEGEIYFQRAFVDSINVYFAKKAIEDIGKGRLDEVADRCGMDKTLAFDFGRMNSSYSFNNDRRELARTAIGQQNVQMSAMHVAMLTQGISAGGTAALPHMLGEVSRTVKGGMDSNGEAAYSKGELLKNETVDTAYMKLCSSEAADIIGEAMTVKGQTLAEKYSGQLEADAASMRIACKTGTAEIDNSYGGYSGYNNIWLTSYAPADDPRYVVVLNRYYVDSQSDNSNGETLYKDLVKVYDRLLNEGE